MPFTRPLLSYPYPRLLFRVLIDLHGWVNYLHVPREDRKEVQAKLIEMWGLEEAKAEGIITRYKFHWHKSRGTLERVWIPAGPKYRRVPGIAQLRKTLSNNKP
jgi:hypothetical protein